MRMGVGIRSGRYIARSGDILFMDFAMNRCVVVFWSGMCSCFVCVCALRLFDLVLYYRLLCVHWRRCLYPIWFFIIACCVCIGVVTFTRYGFMWLFGVRLAPAHRLATWELGLCGRMWICDPLLRSLSTILHASGVSSPAPAVPVRVGGSCSTRAMTPASGSGKHPSFKQRVLMITHGGELSTAAMEEVVQISSTASATILSPTPLHVPASSWG